jgi:lipoprotein-anchoring transpeptidase ErfK/SrfK
LRASLSLTVIACALAASVGSVAAQYYPPQPPPVYQGYAPYARAPLPPPDDGTPVDPRYRQVGPAAEQSDAYTPGTPPYFVPDNDNLAPQPLPSLSGGPVLRPPADVSEGPSSGDVTGSVPGARGPAAVAPPDRGTVVAALPPEDQPEQGPTKELPPQFRRQLVDYVTREPAGTLIIDTPHTYLYLVLGNGTAMRYGIGVGREGFTWTGTERISRMSEWPDWHPPKEMIERQPYLPRFMAGGEGNPLGARAMYLGNTLYRIHGTNQPSTIGTFVSSGCIRLTNEDVADLYGRVNVGTRVVVLPGSGGASASSQAPTAR